MRNDPSQGDGSESDATADTAVALPTLRERIEQWLGFQLPALPALPQTIRNLDKVGAALLDWPGAVLEGKASSARSAAAQRDVLEFAITAAMKRQLGKASSEEVKTAVDGMVLEYLSRHHGRKRVLEHAATELENDPPIEDAKSELSDDFMAFFKGKVDNLGTEEARVLFGKVLAGEVKRPGSFSKAAMSILAEMDTEVGQLFDRLCNMSVAHPLGPRVLTIGMGNASHNSLSPFGLDFGALNRLNEAGLIIADYNSRCGMSTPVDLAGATYDLVLNPMSPELREAKVKEIGEKLQTVEGVAFTRAGGELRQIVALRLNPEYFNRLKQSFGEIGAALVAGS